MPSIGNKDTAEYYENFDVSNYLWFGKYKIPNFGSMLIGNIYIWSKKIKEKNINEMEYLHY